jgi:hypothetical protein
MSFKTLGQYVRNSYNKWHLRTNTVLDYQEKNMIYELTLLKNHLTNEIIEDASCGSKFRRFYYNELDTSKLFYKSISQYHIDLIMKHEELDIKYEKDSFVLSWAPEIK